MRHITKRENKSKQNREEKQAAYCVSAKGEVNSACVSKFRPLCLTRSKTCPLENKVGSVTFGVFSFFMLFHCTQKSSSECIQ